MCVRKYVYTLAQHMCTPCEVLPATCNRDGRDISAQDAMCCAKKHTDSGFVLSRLRCVSAQMPEDKKMREAIIVKSENAAALDESLPRVKRGLVGYVGFGGNTCNTGWRMINQARPMTCYISDKVGGVDVISWEKLNSLDSDQAACCKTGAPWIVLTSKIWTEEPAAANIIQKAENLMAQNSKLPGWLDGMMRGAAMVCHMDSEDAVSTLQKQMPNFSPEQIQVMVFACERMGGGDSRHLQLWFFLSNHFVPGDRELPKPLLQSIVNLPLSYPVVKVCLMYTAQLCPLDQVSSSNACNWISAGDVKKMRGQDRWKNYANEMEEHIQKRSMGLRGDSPSYLLAAYSNLLARAGRWILEKRHAEFDEHSSLAEILDMHDAEQVDNRMILKASARVDGGAAPRAHAVVKMASKNIVRYNSDGSIQDQKRLLGEAGLALGVYLYGRVWNVCQKCTKEKPCDDKSKGTCPATKFSMLNGWVSELNDDDMTITLIDHDERKKKMSVSYTIYARDWKLQFDKAAIQDRGLLADWSVYQTHQKKESQDRAGQAQVRVALGVLLDTIWKNMKPQGLRTESKPVKKVFAMKDYKAGELVLVPFSESLVADSVTPQNLATKLMTDAKGAEGKPIWISKPTMTIPREGEEAKKGNLEIFWCVRDLVPLDGGAAPPADDKVNMTLKQYRVIGAIAVRPEGSPTSTERQG